MRYKSINRLHSLLHPRTPPRTTSRDPRWSPVSRRVLRCLRPGVPHGPQRSPAVPSGPQRSPLGPSWSPAALYYPDRRCHRQANHWEDTSAMSVHVRVEMWSLSQLLDVSARNDGRLLAEPSWSARPYRDAGVSRPTGQATCMSHTNRRRKRVDRPPSSSPHSRRATCPVLSVD